MAQHDYNIANQTFPSFRSDLNNALSAIQTTNSGTSLPTGAVAGQIWLDTTNATNPTLKFYDGADSISLATINYTANTVDWLDSSVSVTGLSTSATGTVLTLSDTVTTSTVNLIIDNQKEIRFRETTANGTNYVAFKAPASLSSDITYILPSTDATVTGQALTSNASGTLSWTTISSGTAWQSVQTTGFTASAGKGYPCNTTSSAFTVILPASPSVGDYVQIVDYAGTFATNNLTINPNGLKIQSQTSNVKISKNNEALVLTYIDSTSGWKVTSAANEGTTALAFPYSVDFLVIAGGGGGGLSYNPYGEGGGGGGAGGYRSSNATYGSSGGGGSAESSLTFNNGTVYTITVGAGGAGSATPNTAGVNGVASSISGTGLTTITSTGGGSGAGYNTVGNSGGSGGGAGAQYSSGGAGTANQGYAGGAGYVGLAAAGGAGGGAGAVGGNGLSSNTGGTGGAGVASSITGSSVTRGGGGGGGGYLNIGTGGTGGGGSGGRINPNDIDSTSGTANTGGGGGGDIGGYGTAGSGGSGVVILRMPTANYSGTTTGSPTVTTSGSDTILVFNASGTYTG